ncbi:MAG: T9SS type A sorting domain-containing protein [Bacteroidales bacterium]|jgi:hypothetical protein
MKTNIYKLVFFSLLTIGMIAAANYSTFAQEYRCSAPSAFYVSSVTTTKSSVTTANAGTSNVAIIYMTIATGFSGATLTAATITSKNTNDADVTSVKLYWTTTTTFATTNLIGSASFSGGNAVFSSISWAIGTSVTRYLWVAYDVSATATNADILSCKVATCGLTFSTAGSLPTSGFYDPSQSISVLGASASSDIIAASNETANIDYASKTGSSITATTDAIRVWSFTVRDGGGSADADAFPTILTAVTLTKGSSDGVTSWANTIKEAALFDGSTKIQEVSVTGESIAFSGMSGANVTAADGGSKTLDLYLTFETTNITDNQQFQFKITSANSTAATSSTSSQFASFSDASSSVTGDNDRIEVTATALGYVQQPTGTLTNTNVSPAVTVEAKDANGMRDLDFTSTIRITASGGTLTGSPVTAVASSGLATFSTLQFSATATGVTLNAERDGTLDWDVTSNSFNIISYSWYCSKYTGTGSTKSITEIGFMPDFVIIKADAAYPAVIKTSTMASNESQDATSTSAYLTDAITSFDANGFTLGTNTGVNNNTTVYYYEAFKQNTNFVVGSYTGDGTTGSRNITVGSGAWRADFIITIPAYYSGCQATHLGFDNAGTGYYDGSASGGGTSSYAGASTDGFNALYAVGISVLNTSGKVYNYAAWNAYSGGMKVGKYTGTGSDNVDISGLGFQPNFVVTYEFGVAGTNHMRNGAITTDNALPFSAGAGAANYIQAFSSDAFQAGTGCYANGTVYAYAAFGGSDGVLPIELTEFKAEYIAPEKTAILRWATASEINNDYFTIEKATDAKNFKMLTTVKGAGNSNATLNYSTKDNEPGTGIIYYRLKQTDFDGKYEYSNVIAINTDDKNTNLSLTQPYFNEKEINTTVANIDGSALSVEIIDYTGGLVCYKTYETGNDKSIVLKLPAYNLAKGAMYFMRVSDGKKSAIKKFIY